MPLAMHQQQWNAGNSLDGMTITFKRNKTLGLLSNRCQDIKTWSSSSKSQLGISKLGPNLFTAKVTPLPNLLSFCELVTTSLLAPRGLFLFRVWISDLLLGPLLGCLIYSGNPLLCCSLSATWEKAEWKAESKSFVKTLLRKKLPVSKCRQTDFITHPSCTELILSLRIIESWPKVFFGASNMKMGPISDMIHQTMAMLMIG